MGPGWRATFHVAALYLVVGATLPYLPVWMEEARGLSGAEIGGAIAAGTTLRAVLGPFLAAWGVRRGLAPGMAGLSAALAFAFAALYPDAGWAALIGLIALVYTLWGVAMPLSEALLIASTKSRDPEYGVARAIGSAAFIFASLSAGALVRGFGPGAALYWLIAASGLMAATALLLGGQPPSAAAPPRLIDVLRRGGALLRTKRIFAASLAVALIQSSHALYYNLGSNIWLRQGIGEVHIGALWSVGVAVEVALLAGSAVIFRTWTPGALILLGGAGATLRWATTGFLPPLALLYGVQGLHALSFAATHLGIVRFLAEEAPEDQIPVLMTVNSALFFGPLLAIGGFGAGLVYDAMAGAGAAGQAKAYWLMAGAASLGALLSLRVLRRPQPQSAGSGGDTQPSR